MKSILAWLLYFFLCVFVEWIGIKVFGNWSFPENSRKILGIPIKIILAMGVYGIPFFVLLNYINQITLMTLIFVVCAVISDYILFKIFVKNPLSFTAVLVDFLLWSYKFGIPLILFFLI